uniref:PDZ domain-containing protein n=1 Tax=Ascaris lumbricoides TaxID=6252 RepID=A0A0M3IQ01_ASCLU
MSLRRVVLERPSPDFTYGFTIRHIAIYPPEVTIIVFMRVKRVLPIEAVLKPLIGNEMDESGTMGDDQLWEIYSTPFHSAVISRVEPLSYAAEGGLKCGDRIVALNDEPICELSYEQICEIIRTRLFAFPYMQMRFTLIAIIARTVTVSLRCPDVESKRCTTTFKPVKLTDAMALTSEVVAN